MLFMPEDLAEGETQLGVRSLGARTPWSAFFIRGAKSVII